MKQPKLLLAIALHVFVLAVRGASTGQIVDVVIDLILIDLVVSILLGHDDT